VIKNTLMRRALEGTDAAELEALFEGPSAVAFVQEDPVAAAKSVTAAARKFPTLVLKGGFVEGRVLSADQAKALADLESREVMLSRLAGMMKAEMARAAGMFQSAQSRFLSLLEAFKAKLPAEAEAEAADAEPADAPTREAEASADAEAPADEPASESQQTDDTNEPEAAASDGPGAEAPEGEE
jgi:large subunit ribosomal protein L10